MGTHTPDHKPFRRSGAPPNWNLVVAAVAAVVALLAAWRSYHLGSPKPVVCPFFQQQTGPLVERMRQSACPKLIPTLAAHGVDWNHTRFMLLPTRTHPSFLISLHPQEVDVGAPERWRIYDTGMYHEPFLSAIVDQFVRNVSLPGIVVDVGSSLGWMALYAASLGHKVVAFEPSPHNALRICESVAVNEFHDSILVETEAVTNDQGKGEIAWGKDFSDASLKGSKRGASGRKYLLPVKLTTLDNWFERHEKRDILLLKVSTVGYEPYALQGAQQLLKDCTVYTVVIQLYQGPGGLNAKAIVRWSINGMAKLGYKLKTIYTELHSTRAEYTINQFYQNQDPMAIVMFCKMDPRKFCHLVWVKEDAAPKCNEAPLPQRKLIS